MFLEIIRHDGPARLGRLRHDGQGLKLDVPTPNFFSIAVNEKPMAHDLYLAPHSSIVEGENVLFDYGSLYGEKPISRLGILPDARVGFKAPREIAKQAVGKTVEFAAKYPDHGAVVQGSKYADLRRVCAEALAERPLLAIADGAELLSNPRLLVKIVTEVRDAVSPNTALYYPFAPPYMFYPLAYMGVDIFDTGVGLINARKGLFSTTRGTLKLKDLSELPCSCSACLGKSPKDLIEDYSSVLGHNFNLALSVIKEIRVAIRAGTFRELVEEKASVSPRTMAALRILDREKQDFLEKFTPTAP